MLLIVCLVYSTRHVCSGIFLVDNAFMKGGGGVAEYKNCTAVRIIPGPDDKLGQILQTHSIQQKKELG